MGSGKTVFISDTHIGDANFTAGREALFLDFLQRYVLNDDGVDAVWGLGDMFDLLQGSWNAIVEDKKELGKRMNEVGEHADFHVIAGNHDLGLHKKTDFSSTFPHLQLHPPVEKRIILRERVGDDTTPKGAERTLASGRVIHPYGKRVQIAHGYEYDHYFARNPNRYDLIIRLGGILQELLGPNADDRVFDAYQKVMRMLGNDPDVRQNAKELLLAARDMAQYRVRGRNVVRREEPLDHVVMGHTHRQANEQLYDEVLAQEGPLKTEYVNTGCWVDAPGYRGSDFSVMRDDGTITNHRWEDMA